MRAKIKNSPRLYFFFLLLYLMLPLPIQAEWSSTEPLKCQQDGVATLKGFECLFAIVILKVLRLIGLATFIMIVVGGFKYLTSGGDAKATATAQQTITLGVVGLVLAISSWFILNAISGFTGANIMNFVVGLPDSP